MGYTTTFKGALGFVKEPSASQLAALNAMFGEDCREHPEWNAPGLYAIDLKLTDDFTGVEWDGTEKTYDMGKLVNVVIEQMRKKWPDFALTGQLAAQGERVEDRWALVIGADGLAEKKLVALTGTIVECPHCGSRFELESAKEPA